MTCRLIVGLGNPGKAYRRTRHNVGEQWVKRLSDSHSIKLRLSSKFRGYLGSGELFGQSVKLLVPTTYMNRSGSAVAATKNYFRISTQEILLVHDETAFDLGKCRLKQGGGANGHNGLIDIIRMLGSDSSFSRLRIGVGQPMTSAHLSKFLTVKELTREERKLWLQSSDLDRDTLRWIIEGDFQKAMTRLHSRGNNIDASTLTDSDR